MDAQGLGRTHPLTPTRRLKQHTHAYNPGTARKVSELINAIARLIRAVSVLVDALGRWL